jgi:F-type H+-transporting ATPase subunit a
MITRLFSSFDPCSSSLIFNNWLRSFLILLVTPSLYWSINNRHAYFFSSFITRLHNDFKLLIPQSVIKESTLIFLSLIILIAVNNFLGLFPYIFTSTSQLVISLTLACPLWFTFIFYGWILNTKHIFTHLVPLSTPAALIPFIVLIETIRNVIRPGTLTVRLSANIIAGHLLLTLLGNQTSHHSSSLIVFLLLIAQVLLLLLESAVALIQAYVFTVLSTLYSSEVLH